MTPGYPLGVTNPSQSDQRVDFAWRVHEAHEAWVNRADAKASILIAIQGALIVATMTMSPGPTGWGRVLGIGLLLLALGVAAVAVAPILGQRAQLRRSATDNLIYFGHVRHLDFETLRQRLHDVDADQELAMIARQLTRLSRISWVKHSLLQASVVVMALGILVLAVALLTV